MPVRFGPIALCGALALLALAAGCTPDARAARRFFESCDGAGDCESGNCVHNVCTKACTSNGECGGGVCQTNVCVPVAAVGCTTDAQCSGVPTGSVCLTAACSSGHCSLKPVVAPTTCATGCTAGKAIVGSCGAGACVATAGVPAKDCADGNPCTADECLDNIGCRNAAVAAPCNDGDACTKGDACVAGTCTPGQPDKCDDKNMCTTDSCSKTDGCQHAITAKASCEDGDLCTEKDTCSSGGICLGTAVVCAAGTACAANVCKYGKCVVVNAAQGEPCNDGSVCTTIDYCDDKGGCIGKKLNCDDNNDCTSDSCDATKGCAHAAAIGSCDDLNACTVKDTCLASKCVGSPKACPDGGPCGTATCSKGVCSVKLAGASTPCDDGSACTTGDVCNGAGACMGKLVVCDDGDACTQDVCDFATGKCASSAMAPGSSCGVGLACQNQLQNDPALLGRWTMDTCDGTDSSALNNAGSLNGTTQCVDGKVGKALALNGKGYLEIPTLSYAGSAISWGGWVKLNVEGAYTVIAGREGGYLLGVRPEGPMSGITVATPAITAWEGKSPMTTGAWHHVVVVYDGSLARHYIDGLPAATYPISGAIAASACHFAIGARTVGCSKASQLFDGAVDDMFVFGRALAASEVFALANNGWGGGCTAAPLPCTASADCDDKDACTTDNCSAGTCVHASAPDKTACDDADTCSGIDSCVAGKCVGSGVKACPDSGNPCNITVCNRFDAACVGWQVPDGQICGDGVACLASACTATACGDGACGGNEAATSCLTDCAAQVVHLSGPCTAVGSPFACGDGYVCVARSQAGGGPVCVADFDTWLPMPDAHTAADFSSFAQFVTDKHTGLSWSTQTVPPVALANAATACTAQNYGGFLDWRLPTRAELNSLVDLSSTAPALAAPGLLVTAPAWTFWAIVPVSGNGASAWQTSFEFGDSATSASTTASGIRCVR